jgi:tetratricopeptide (TPR) repeat protein
MQAGQMEQALSAAGKAVAYWPAEPAHHLLLGRVYWAQAGANPAAADLWLAKVEERLHSAQRLRPSDPLLWLYTGQFYSNAGEHVGRDTRAEAEAAFRQAAHLAPNQAAVYTAWGRAALSWGATEQGAALLRQAVRLDASSGEAYLYLGAAELALDRREIALADYREAARLLPASAAAQAGLAHAHWRLGQVDAARRAAEEALRKDPQNGLARTLMGDMHNLSSWHGGKRIRWGRVSGQE